MSTQHMQPKALRLAEAMNTANVPFEVKCDTAAELRRLHKVNQELLAALHDAATSLETIGRIAGKSTYLGDDGERIPTYMEHHDEVRGYASSRAGVARTAIAKAS